LIGRFEQPRVVAPVFAWLGAVIAVRFVGAAIGVTLGDDGNNLLEVVLGFLERPRSAARPLRRTPTYPASRARSAPGRDR
jgi:hypothetical protein